MSSPQDVLAKIAFSHARGISRTRLAVFLRRWCETQGPSLKRSFWTWLETEQAIQVDWSLVEEDRRWCEAHACTTIVLTDPEYPEWLRHIPDPPVLLYIQGNLSLLSSKMFAIVGSRQPSPHGEQLAFDFAKKLTEAGLLIVSGLALGVDGAAHRGALHCKEGNTIAVLGSGLATVYPQRHCALAREIQNRGVLISEYAPKVGPYPAHFPQRNRIISGLSQGVLVVEAGLKSGSLITARLALEQNREVMALPGSLGNPLSQGTHRLIQEGALLVTDPQDILEALHWPKVGAIQPNEAPRKESVDKLLDPELQKVLHYVGFDCTSIEEVVRLSGLAVEEVAGKLMALDLLGKISAIEGGYIRRYTQSG